MEDDIPMAGPASAISQASSWRESETKNPSESAKDKLRPKRPSKTDAPGDLGITEELDAEEKHSLDTLA
jgi:hypothetical protein